MMPFAMSMMAVLMFFIMLSAVFFGITHLMMRHIDIIVPTITHEIDWTAAGIIFIAVLAPFFLMTGRYMHVDWLMNNPDRGRVDNHRSCVNEFWFRIVSDVNATIKAWLTYADRYTDIGCLG